jgi:hypothetical protein
MPSRNENVQVRIDERNSISAVSEGLKDGVGFTGLAWLD